MKLYKAKEGVFLNPAQITSVVGVKNKEHKTVVFYNEYKDHAIFKEGKWFRERKFDYMFYHPKYIEIDKDIESVVAEINECF